MPFHSFKRKILKHGIRIEIGGDEIKRKVDNANFINEALTWNKHVNVVANKIAKNIGVTKRIPQKYHLI